jgi:hypothetical protein
MLERLPSGNQGATIHCPSDHQRGLSYLIYLLLSERYSSAAGVYLLSGHNKLKIESKVEWMVSDLKALHTTNAPPKSPFRRNSDVNMIDSTAEDGRPWKNGRGYSQG